MTNEQWDAIVESRARAIAQVRGLDPDGKYLGDKAWRVFVPEATAALSGVRELIEAGEAKLDAYLGILEDARRGYHNVEDWGSFGPNGSGLTYDEMLDAAEADLRSTIKGVRDE